MTSLFPSLRRAVADKDVYIVGTDDWILDALLEVAERANLVVSRPQNRMGMARRRTELRESLNRLRGA